MLVRKLSMIRHSNCTATSAVKGCSLISFTTLINCIQQQNRTMTTNIPCYIHTYITCGPN